MGIRSSKHSEVKTITAGFEGGLNLFDGAPNIADNQQVDCRNFYYVEEGDDLVTRPGVKLVSRVKIGEVLLTVILHPVQGGWRIVGSNDWLASGVSISLPTGGVYELEFQDVEGYRTPGGSTLTLVEDTVIDAYYRFLYSLIINLGLPDEVINPAVTVEGVTAQTDSTRVQRKFRAVSDEYDITYERVLGYVSPKPESCDLVADTTLNRNYYSDMIAHGFNAMAYGNGLYVGTRDDPSAGAVYISSDGITWVNSYALAAPTSSPMESSLYVAFGNGVFVLAGKTEDRHIVATSTDGVNWTEQLVLVSGAGKYSQPINFCNGKFITTLTNWAGVWSSSDGVAWDKRSDRAGFRHAQYFNGEYYFTTLGAEYVSSPGLSFFAQTRGDIPYGGTLYGIGAHDGLIYVPSTLGSTGLVAFFSSADGQQWTQLPCSRNFTICYGLARTDNYWFVSCYAQNHTPSTPRLYRSADMENWYPVQASYGAINLSYAFGDYRTGFYLLNGRLFVSDPQSNVSIIIEDV